MARSPSTASVTGSSDLEKGDAEPHNTAGSQSLHDEKLSHDTRGEESFMNAQAVVGDPLEDDDFIHPEPAAEPQGTLSRVVSRVITRTSTKSVAPGPPPDGGWTAWSQALVGHLVVMNTWGQINSFGVFQTYFATTLNHPPSDISWIGSVQVFLLFFIGTMTGRLTDAGYFRQIFFLGSVLQIVGIFTTSAATEYWQLFLSQGICIGLGNGCLFCPSLAVLSTFFSKRRSLAIGIAATGSATGGLIFPSVVRQLLPTAGFGWTVRAIGFIQLATLVVANIGLRTRLPPRRTGPFVEWAAFKETEYSLYACGAFFCFISMYFGFYYLASFSRDIIGMSYSDSLNLLLVVNGAGAFGRLVPNYLADRFGPITVMVPTVVAAGTCVLSWMAVSRPAGLYAWTVFYGFAAGGIQSLFPAGLSSLTTDLRKAGVRLGMVFTIVSFAGLTGPPIAGAIISVSGGKYYGAQAFAGTCLLLGACFFMAARIVRSRKIQGDSPLWNVKV